MLFCENFVLHLFGQLSTLILKTQRLKTHFFENGSQGGQRIHILSEMTMPLSQPSTSCLRPLNPTMSHNNNNGGLHACVCATEDIEPFLQLTHLVDECESQQQFDLISGPHKRFRFPCTSHFHLLVVFGFSFYCLFTAARFMCMLCVFFSVFGECQVPPKDLEYELQRFWLFSVDLYGQKYS